MSKRKEKHVIVPRASLKALNGMAYGVAFGSPVGKKWIADFVKHVQELSFALTAKKTFTTTIEKLLNNQLDLTGAENCEVVIKEDGKVLWINVEGVCALRVCRIDNLVLDDRRRTKSPMKLRRGRKENVMLANKGDVTMLDSGDCWAEL